MWSPFKPTSAQLRHNFAHKMLCYHHALEVAELSEGARATTMAVPDIHGCVSNHSFGPSYQVSVNKYRLVAILWCLLSVFTTPSLLHPYTDGLAKLWHFVILRRGSFEYTKTTFSRNNYVFIVTLCVSWAWGYAVKSTSPKSLQKLQILHPVPTKSFSSGIYFYIEKTLCGIPMRVDAIFFNWTSPWKNMKHWLIICRMNHRPLQSGSSELVKTHNGYGRDKTRRINEI